MDHASDLDSFRADTAAYLASCKESGVACRAFGAILPPALLDAALTWQSHLAQTGYAGLHWPAEFGGQGLSRSHSTVWYEECAKAEVAPYLNLQGLILAGEAIIRSGTDAQKQRFLASTLSGEILWCQLFSEPGAGSDLAGLQSRAELDGDRYVLNGQKVWSSNASDAQYGILMARTDPDAPKHKGISFFLLDMALPGVDVRPLRQMTGDSEFCEVFFDDVEVPVEALLGGPGEGWRVAMDVLGDERGSFGAAGAISFRHKLDSLAGMSAGSSGTTVARGELADLMVRANALQALLMRLSADPTSGPVAKLLRTEVEIDANGLAASLRGPGAMLWDETTEAMLYAPGMRIAGGSSEIQRNIIGERLLGLPREPSPPSGG